MKRLLWILPILPLTFVAPACDPPEEEVELAALDVEDNDEAQAAEKINNGVPSFDEFDLEADETPAAFPPGICCKALCTWNPNNWQQLPQPYTQADNCNANADYFCGYQHLIDAQWRTCG